MDQLTLSSLSLSYSVYTCLTTNYRILNETLLSMTVNSQLFIHDKVMTDNDQVKFIGILGIFQDMFMSFWISHILKFSL